MYKLAQQRGFTLLEVLVAFVIAALALVVLMQVFSGGLRLSSTTEDYARASILSESLLAQIGPEYGLEDSPISGTFDERFNWIIEITPYVMDAEPLQNKPAVMLVKLAISINWESGLQQRRFELSSLRLIPRLEQ